MGIPWDKIKNGFKGFEKLAVKYVQVEYSSKFDKTNDTRDGNKDAVAIFVNYNDGTSEDISEWWMEAKYSKNNPIITRYRLDPTIVSAILSQKVKKVFIVTNQDLHPTAINSLQKALYLNQKIEGIFCHKDILEYWLFKHKKIFSHYFPNVKLPPAPIDITIIKNMSFTYLSNNMSGCGNSLKVLYLGETIIANFSVYSPNNCKVAIKGHTSLRGIVKIKPKEISLKKGINVVSFSFVMNENYGYKSKAKRNCINSLPTPAFKFGNKQITSEISVTVCKNTIPRFTYPSQEYIVNKIVRSLNSGIQKYIVYKLNGKLGVGKSYSKQLVLDSIDNSDMLIFDATFMRDEKHNCRILTSIVDFLIFPFVPSEMIDDQYIISINANKYIALTAQYKCLCHEKHIQEKNTTFWKEYSGGDKRIIPDKIYSNKMLVVIDDFHKAQPYIQSSIAMLIVEVSISNIDCRFLIIEEENTCIDKIDWDVSTDSYNLSLTADDFTEMLSMKEISPSINFAINNISISDDNLIVRFYFLQYLFDHREVVSETQDINILLATFYNNNLWEFYVKRKFDNCFSKNDKVRELCNQIYWKKNGKERKLDNQEEENLLLYNLLAKEDGGKLYPYDDLTAQLYRRANPPKLLEDKTLTEMIDNQNIDNIKVFKELCEKYINKSDYTTVYHGLYETFSRDTKSFKNMVGNDIYCHFLYLYAISATHYSIDISAKDIWEELYRNTTETYLSSKSIFKYRLQASWELTNTAFEWLQYDNAIKKCDELDELVQKYTNIFCVNDTSVDSMYLHNTNVIRCMIASELIENIAEEEYQDAQTFMRNSNKIDRLHSFRVRYSLTLMRREPQTALNIIKTEKNWFEKHRDSSIQNDKYYYWASFYYSYMMVTWKKEINKISQLMTTLEEIRRYYFNDYRKMLFGTAIFLYANKEIDKAEEFMERDKIVTRLKRPRLEGFYETAMALSCIFHNNYKGAIGHFEKSLSCFKNIQNYSDIIEHNIHVIEQINVVAPLEWKPIIEYAYANITLKSEIIYVDPRCSW